MAKIQATAAHFKRKPILRSAVVTVFALFSLFVPQAQAWDGAQCGEFLSEVHVRGGVALSAEEARLYDIGPRGVLRVMHKDRFSAEQKVQLWRAAVEAYREKDLFVNDEVWFDFKGQQVVAFIGVASSKLKTLLFIFADGRVFLTNTPEYLGTVIERKGGGLTGAMEGTSMKAIMPDEFLVEYLGNILSFAMGEGL